MKKILLSIIIVSTIIIGYTPLNVGAETITNINVLEMRSENIKYENGTYEVKNKTLKVDSDRTSAARSYVSEDSVIEISDDTITATIEFTNKNLMSNTRIKVNGKEVEYIGNDVSDANLNLKFKLESLSDTVEVSTTINLGFVKMNVSFRVQFDTIEIPIISGGSSDNDQTQPEEVPPTTTPGGDNNTGNEEIVNEGKYTIENDALHISKDEESLARKYLEYISDVEYKEGKIYLTLKFTGKSMMTNHVIQVNGSATNFDIVDESGENFYVRFEIGALSDSIIVSTKVLGTMDVGFRVKLKDDTLKLYTEGEEAQKPNNNNAANGGQQGPIESTDKEETQKPSTPKNENSTVYKVKNEIITDSIIGYTAARAAVNNTSYIEDIDGVKYITVGLSQLDVMSNIRVSVNGSNINYEVVRKSSSSNTMDIRFKVPSVNSSIKITAFINATRMDISFGLDLLEDTMEVIRKSEASIPLATESISTMFNTVNTEEVSQKNSKVVAKDIEVGEYFKKYTIENDIISDSAMGRAMTRKYLDKLSILEDIDGKLYLTLKFSGTSAMENIKITVNGQEVEFAIVATDEENEMKAFRFTINDISDEIRVYMNIKAVNMDVDFGVDLLEETQILIEEGTISDSMGKEDAVLATLMSNKKEQSNLKVILITALATTIIILSLQGIIYSIIKKRENKSNLKEK
ncbi:NEAT domain-containing protein [Clostridium sp. D53t1_180928_C8]|uniref:NEAT domain-containing protein n=1 Tax=Clostridium sp. D53t1_180928_C8 TaxID=2787101 RepID=UPI0018AACC49|nr:NEAT domain-containing protein [Clostridium sp. D53t1_180928_C8]